MHPLNPILLLLLLTLNLTANTPSRNNKAKVGNLSSVIHANGNQEIYTYDTLNRLTSLEHQNANTEMLASFAYILSPLGERVEIVENNRSTSYNYDELSRVISEEITDSKNGDYSSSYTYDEVSNRIRWCHYTI